MVKKKKVAVKKDVKLAEILDELADLHAIQFEMKAASIDLFRVIDRACSSMEKLAEQLRDL